MDKLSKAAALAAEISGLSKAAEPFMMPDGQQNDTAGCSGRPLRCARVRATARPAEFRGAHGTSVWPTGPKSFSRERTQEWVTGVQTPVAVTVVACLNHRCHIRQPEDKDRNPKRRKPTNSPAQERPPDKDGIHDQAVGRDARHHRLLQEAPSPIRSVPKAM